MQKKLWEATISQKENSNLRSFEKFLNNKYNFKSNKNYKKLLKWSLQNPSSFWSKPKLFREQGQASQERT